MNMYKKQKEYFEKKWINSWLEWDIPFDITTNSCYVNQVKSFIKDNSKKVKVLEVWWGLWLFALNFLNNENNISYLLTDYSSKVISDLKKNSYINKYIKKWYLNLEIYDIVNDNLSRNYFTKEWWFDLIIFNYVLCCIPTKKQKIVLENAMKFLNKYWTILISDSSIINNKITSTKYWEAFSNSLDLNKIKRFFYLINKNFWNKYTIFDNEKCWYVLTTSLITNEDNINTVNMFKNNFIKKNNNIECFENLRNFYKLYQSWNKEKSFEYLKYVYDYRKNDANIIFRINKVNYELYWITDKFLLEEQKKYDYFWIFEDKVIS